ncbi:MAG: hypothetical protein HF970_11095 [ANME-2 cluster archaeon]|nr:hypothetical protein [ANME-2 cluster archaeon]
MGTHIFDSKNNAIIGHSTSTGSKKQPPLGMGSHGRPWKPEKKILETANEN